MVIKRVRMVRNALLMLYSAIGCMVLTSFSLAITELGWVPEQISLPIWIFLMGLFSILLAVIQEMFEVRLALKALNLDSEGNA